MAQIEPYKLPAHLDKLMEGGVGEVGHVTWSISPVLLLRFLWCLAWVPHEGHDPSFIVLTLVCVFGHPIPVMVEEEGAVLSEG